MTAAGKCFRNTCFFVFFVRVAGNGEIRLRPFPGDNPFIAAQSSYATSFEP